MTDPNVDLVRIARDLASVKQAAAAGQLRLDGESAQAVLASLAVIRGRIERLAAEARRLDAPLPLGESWVGHAMSQRLRSPVDVDRLLQAVRDYEQAVQRGSA